MRTGRWHPSLMIAVQARVTHADCLAILERDMGTPQGSSARRMWVICSPCAIARCCRVRGSLTLLEAHMAMISFTSVGS
jgi:hypothetical protein